MSKLQAVILAGGKGSRLRPYTTVLPKPLIPIGEYPILEIIIRQLKYYGIKDIILSTGHLAELIEAYFGKGKRWGVNIRYIRENKPLGTAGALKLVQKLNSNFLVINGDTLTNMNFKKLFYFHLKKKGVATISYKKCITRADFGVVSFDREAKLIGYTEKPKSVSHFSLGINVLNKECRNYIQSGEALGMPELMLRMRNAGKPVFCFESKDIWYDLGRMSDLQPAQDDFEKNKSKFFRR
jgi:NDP-mannose synthase